MLRPGVLWFLRNLNDQNFHPVQEVILFNVTSVLSEIVHCLDDKPADDSTCEEIYNVFCKHCGALMCTSVSFVTHHTLLLYLAQI